MKKDPCIGKGNTKGSATYKNKKDAEEFGKKNQVG